MLRAKSARGGRGLKWFQHHTDAHDDEILRELLHKFGTEGIATWWITAELVAKVLKVVKVAPSKRFPLGYKVTARFEADPRVFADALANKVTIDRIESILKHCTRRKRFYFKVSADGWVVEWPKLVEFKDNATRDLISEAVKQLASPLEAAGTGGASVPPRGSYKGDPSSGEGVQGGKPGGHPVADWLKTATKNFSDVYEVPGRRSIMGMCRQLEQQGVPADAILKASADQTNKTRDFFDVVNDLKQLRPNNDGRGTGDGNRGNGNGKHGTGKVGEHGLTDDDVTRRFRERIDKREGAAQQGSGDAAAAPQ